MERGPWCSSVWIDATEHFVCGELQLVFLIFGERADPLLERGPGDGAHLEHKRDGSLRRGTVVWLDHRSAGQMRAIEVRGERNDEDGLEHARQRIALPDDDGTTAGLLLRTMAAEISPPDFASPQRSSSSFNDPPQ